MTPADVQAVVGLQRDAFPPPFDEDLLWQAVHIQRHLEVFPAGQFVATDNGRIIGSCSNTLVSEAAWHAHGSWDQTVGGPLLNAFDVNGSTLYGLDVSVHPDFRRQGVGRAFYAVRFDLVRTGTLTRYGTACRLPDFSKSGVGDVEAYVYEVVTGRRTDRTLSPLLTYGLRYSGVIRNYMDDPESGNAAAMLEWIP